MNGLRSNPEHLVRRSISKFVDKELASSKAQKFDNSGEFPKALFAKLADMGVFEIRYLSNKRYRFRRTTTFCIVCEELARGLMSLASITAMQSLMATNFLFYHGSDRMKDDYFFPAMAGEKIGSFCLTEPEAGSDLGSVLTSSTKVDGGYVINGTKTWITNGPNAHFFTVLCQTDPQKRVKGLSFCFVPRNFEGVSTSLPFDCVGTRTTPLCEVAFKDVFIPEEYCLIPPGRGVGALMSILSEIRTMTAALGVGLQKAALDDSIKYARERFAWGKTISKYQLIQAKIAEMSVNLEASKLMTYQAASMIDSDKDCVREATMAKYFVTEAACKAADNCTRIFGAYGYSSEYPAQRYYRDTRFLLNGGGTHEVLLTNIARMGGL